ncbi:MAG TPA: hypothetical protein PK880_07750 [Candidatus Competibacter sp.]|nr:hypothetical protein [Candidatus Competibacteraceae bacterium]HRC72414.1 hypothetical protein [Candidatus Competibacter sp.]
MNFRTKTVWAIMVEFAAVWPPIAGLEVWIVRPSFQKWRKDQASEVGTRPNAATQNELRRSDNGSGNWWAERDGAYVAGDRAPAFVRTNLGGWR